MEGILSPDTSAKLFELFLNGSDINEIHRLNKNFPYEAILWSRVKYDWDKLKDEYAASLTGQVAQKVIKASLETTSLLTDMLAVAHKKHGDKLKKYLQTGDEADLGDALSIDTIHGLLKAVEGLQKVTGQDRTHNINKKEVVNLNVNVQGVPQVGDDTAKTIIAAVAKEKWIKCVAGVKMTDERKAIVDSFMAKPNTAEELQQWVLTYLDIWLPLGHIDPDSNSSPSRMDF